MTCKKNLERWWVGVASNFVYQLLIYVIKKVLKKIKLNNLTKAIELLNFDNFFMY